MSGVAVGKWTILSSLWLVTTEEGLRRWGQLAGGQSLVHLFQFPLTSEEIKAGKGKSRAMVWL